MGKGLKPMKQTLIVGLSLCLLAGCLAGCAAKPSGLSDAQYCSEFGSQYFGSMEELYTGLRDMTDSAVNFIRRREDLYMEDTAAKTRVTEAERKNGIFGNMRETLLTENTLLIPYYKGEVMPLDGGEGRYGIEVVESRACRKPWIIHVGWIDDHLTGLRTMYYDPALVEEANEKGASWLMREINPEGTNVHTYKKISKELDYPMEVYEQEYTLGDRKVTAMVIDSRRNDGQAITVYFVYDDVLVCAFGRPEYLDKILPDITFREMEFSTNKPLHDRPGRADSQWSAWGDQVEYVDTVDSLKDDGKDDLKDDDALKDDLDDGTNDLDDTQTPAQDDRKDGATDDNSPDNGKEDLTDGDGQTKSE